MNTSHSGGRRRQLSAATAATLVVGVLVALTGQAAPAQAATDDGLAYTCTYGSLGADLRTAVSIDTDLPDRSTVLAPLNISTSVTLVMPQSVVTQLQALPGFTSAKLSPDVSGDGVAETYVEPSGTGTPVIAHPVLTQQSANDDGDVSFSGGSPAPYAMNPGPGIPGAYGVTAGTMTFELVVDATTPTTYHVTCTPPSSSGVLVDSFLVPASTTTAITQAPATWAYGDTSSGVTATVTRTGSTASWPAADGSVQFYADGQAAGDPVSLGAGGTATLTRLPALAPGIHAITATYVPSATSPYLASTSDVANARVEISTTTTVTVDPTAPEVDEPARATATVTGSDGSKAPGQVTFTVDGTALDPETLTDGTATVDLPTGVIGHHTVIASYSGNGLYRDSQSATSSLDVGPHATTTTLSLDKASSSYGEPVTASASVSSASGGPAGTVTFTVDGRSVSAPLRDGLAQATLPPLTAGTYDVKAGFVPALPEAFDSSTAQPQSLTVRIAQTTTTLRIAPGTAAYGGRATATAWVTAAAGEPTGTVVFRVDGRSVSATLVNGSVHVALPVLRPGSYRVTATYLPSTEGTFATSTSAPAAYAVLRDTSWIGQTVTKSHHGKQLRCRFVVHAGHGAETATGEVRTVLTSHGRTLRTRAITLEHGAGTARFAAPKRGRWTLMVRYLGSSTVAAAVGVRHGRSGRH